MGDMKAGQSIMGMGTSGEVTVDGGMTGGTGQDLPWALSIWVTSAMLQAGGVSEIPCTEARYVRKHSGTLTACLLFWGHF